MSVSNVVNTVVDTIDKFTTATDRAGHTIHRVGQLVDAGVSPATIASQLTDNSSNGITYTKDDVVTMSKVAIDSKTKVGVTKTQTAALIKDQKDNAPVAVGVPA